MIGQVNRSAVRQRACVLLALLLIRAGRVEAQVISGTISGIVTDATDASIAQAVVVLTSEGTKATRQTRTDHNGHFAFAAMLPGSYTIRVSASGFNTIEQTGNVLAANSYLDLGRLALQIGQARESVTVTARAQLVQAASSENTALLSDRDLSYLSVRGRDVMGLLGVLPGVSAGPVYEVPNGPGYGNAAPNVMGHPTNWSVASVDGLVSNDAGNGEL